MPATRRSGPGAAIRGVSGQAPRWELDVYERDGKPRHELAYQWRAEPGPSPRRLPKFGSATPGRRLLAVRLDDVGDESATIAVAQLIYRRRPDDRERSATAKAADIAGRATLLRQLQTLAFNVANSYYTVLEDNATVTADAQLVREFEVNEASTAAQIRNGAAARSDLAGQSQSQTAQARGQS